MPVTIYECRMREQGDRAAGVIDRHSMQSQALRLSVDRSARSVVSRIPCALARKLADGTDEGRKSRQFDMMHIDQIGAIWELTGILALHRPLRVSAFLASVVHPCLPW
jgi:hypothetical protein